MAKRHQKPLYSVVVGNVGTVYSIDSLTRAANEFDTYVTLSQAQSGRASGEDVTLLKDDEIIKEYHAEDVKVAQLLNKLEDIADGADGCNLDSWKASSILAMLHSPKYYRSICTLADNMLNNA